MKEGIVLITSVVLPIASDYAGNLRGSWSIAVGGINNTEEKMIQC